MAKILIVDDDRDVVDLLTDILASQPGYEVVFASDGIAALHQLATEKPDLVLLDLRMPTMDGAVLLPKLRAVSRAGIIVLSGRDEQSDRVPALKLADDFIGKPFDIYDLLARVEAVLRRSKVAELPSGPGHAEVRVDDLAISESRKLVTVRGQAIHMTPTEFRLLLEIAHHPNDVLSRPQLAVAVWNYMGEGMTHTLDVHLNRLRAKLGRVVGAPQIITTRGKGIMLQTEAGSAG